MSYFYCASRRGFFRTDINGESIPRDVVLISDERHAELMRGQESGKQIVPDGWGRPVLQDRQSEAG